MKYRRLKLTMSKYHPKDPGRATRSPGKAVSTVRDGRSRYETYPIPDT
jgi:hypothetical protein